MSATGRIAVCQSLVLGGTKFFLNKKKHQLTIEKQQDAPLSWRQSCT